MVKSRYHCIRPRSKPPEIRLNVEHVVGKMNLDHGWATYGPRATLRSGKYIYPAHGGFLKFYRKIIIINATE